MAAAGSASAVALRASAAAKALRTMDMGCSCFDADEFDIGDPASVALNGG
jgi:hypothetical protein